MGKFYVFHNNNKASLRQDVVTCATTLVAVDETTTTRWTRAESAHQTFLIFFFWQQSTYSVCKPPVLLPWKLHSAEEWNQTKTPPDPGSTTDRQQSPLQPSVEHQSSASGVQMKTSHLTSPLTHATFGCLPRIANTSNQSDEFCRRRMDGREGCERRIFAEKDGEMRGWGIHGDGPGR